MGSRSPELTSVGPPYRVLGLIDIVGYAVSVRESSQSWRHDRIHWFTPYRDSIYVRLTVQVDPYLLVCNVDVVDRRARKAIPDNDFRSLLSCCPHRRSFYRPLLTIFRAFENSCADFHAVDENHTAARHEKCRGMISTPPCCRGGRLFTWRALGKHMAVGIQTDSTLALQYGWSGTIDSRVEAYRWTREFKVGTDSGELVVEQEQGQEQEVANRGNRSTFSFQHVTAVKGRERACYS